MDDKSLQSQPKTPTISPASGSQVEVIKPASVNHQLMDKPDTLQPSAQAKEDTSFVWESFTNTVGAVGEVINYTANQTGKAIASLGEAASQQVHDWISPVTQEAGQAVTQISNNWLVRRFSRFLNLNWLIGATSKVDLASSEAAVRKLQQEYPNESPSQIAHRIMVEKATRAGGIGLATSIVPGAALALLAVDLAATTQLQAEMVYQIAAAYGLDLQDSARKGEVLGIFGLGLGGNRLLKAAGLGLLRNVPFAGAVIGASSDAVMIYSLGYAACRFYETKLTSNTVDSQATLASLKQQSDKYLETAIAQQAVMDQILVHVILASHPEKSEAEILPQLKALNLSPTSLEAIAANIKSPQPLDILLNQLNRDFAIPLLAQCYRIVQSNSVVTPEARRVIEAISTKFNLDINSIKSSVDSNNNNRF